MINSSITPLATIPPPSEFQIVRSPQLIERFGFGKGLLNNKLKDGLLPPPISLGERSIGWLKHELDAVLLAMVQGRDKEYIRVLIRFLVDSRQD